MTRELTFIFGPGPEEVSPQEAARTSLRRFVRSEGELGVYEASNNPTGHVLTAWEAYTAYGIEILEEAVEYGSAILRQTRDSTSKALKDRRIALGLSYSSVGQAADLEAAEIEIAESSSAKMSIADLERLAFLLGLDERLLAFDKEAGGDSSLAYRLRTLQTEEIDPVTKLSARTAIRFAEAASIIRVQLRMQKWLGLPMESHKVQPDSNYGSSWSPAWKVGYGLAERARQALNLDYTPINSMRELVENRLGIPVIQAILPERIAGATITTTDEDGVEARGVILNMIGHNENVWIRRATLAHELGHLLYDPRGNLENVRVDSYWDNQRDAETDALDPVEQRANAFAIAFLAPNDAIRTLVPAPVSEQSVSDVMHLFGISLTAARYHIANVHYRNYDVPSPVGDASPSDEQKAAENFAVDFFPLQSTPDQRRGRFAGLVAACCEQGFISEDTASLYLQCTVEDLRRNLGTLRELFDIHT